MAEPHLVQKVGLAAIQHGCVLLVRKRGGSLFILPGGKPEANEDDMQTLSRELREELGCAVRRPCFEHTFTDHAAELHNTMVVVRLYAGELVGDPEPAAEIEEMAWLDLHASWSLPVAPSLSNYILPYLRARLWG